MASIEIVAGSRSQIVEVMLRDNSTGNGLTGLAFDDVSASYVRQGGARVDIPLVAGSAGDSFSAGKFAEVDAVEMRGQYQLHLPDSAVAIGSESCTVQLQAPGAIDAQLKVSLLQFPESNGLNYDRSLDGEFVFDMSGVRAADGSYPRIGELIDHWVSRDGQFTANALPGSTYRLAYSMMRPGRLCIRGKNGFFLDFGGAGSFANDTGNTWHFMGGVVEGQQTEAAAIIMQQEAGGGSATNGVGFGLRPNWAGGGFSGDDSYILSSRPNGAALSTITKHKGGAAGQWNCVVVRKDATGIQAYNPKETTVNENGGFSFLTNKEEVIIGGAVVYDGATYTEGPEMEIESVGVWDGVSSFADAQALAETLDRQSRSIKLVAFGDSRMSNLLFNGTFQLANGFGYNLIRYADNGEVISGADANLDAIIADGDKFEAAVVWIGINDFGTNNYAAAVVADKIIEHTDLVKKIFDNGIAGHVFVMNETPIGSDSNSKPTEQKQKLYDFHEGITKAHIYNPRVTVVDSWAAVQDPEDAQSLDDDLTNDGVHFSTTALANGSTAGYMRFVHDLLLPMIQEYFDDLKLPTATMRNNLSLSRSLGVAIESKVGDATLANQELILAKLAMRSASMNDGLDQSELSLIHFDTYDGVANQKKAWETEKDYTGEDWSIKLLITDPECKTVVISEDGEAESNVLVSIPSLTAEFGEFYLEFLGCPSTAKLAFAVVAVHSEAGQETIAYGSCNVRNRGAVV